MPFAPALLQQSLSAIVGGVMLPILIGWQEGDGAGVAAHFLGEGFSHILPHGLDHILFVLGLFFMCRAFPVLLLQISLFTVAHSLTFGLGMLGLVRVPANVVEPLIALSIAFVAVENILLPQPKRWRQVAVFVFGLVHGLGFANAFQGAEVSLSPATFPIALVSLNFGMGLGHLAVVGVAYLACSAFWGCAWYRKAVAIPASGAIAVVSVWWVVARVVG